MPICCVRSTSACSPPPKVVMLNIVTGSDEAAVGRLADLAW